MTALCGGGPSQPKVGQNPFLILAADKLVNFVETGGMPWLASWVSALGGVTFHLPDFCSTDPPALPTIDAARIASWVLPPDGAVKLRQDMGALVGHFMWFVTCECVSGPQPPAPNPLPNPPGYDRNPPRIVPPYSPAPCDFKNWFQTINLDANGDFELPMFNNTPLVAGVTSVHAEWCGGFPTTGTYPITWQLRFKDANRANVLGTYTWVQNQPVLCTVPKLEFDTTVPPGTSVVDLGVHAANSAGVAVAVNHFLSFGCTGVPDQPVVPCCPPDDSLQQLLFQIYATVQEILAELGNVKRPFTDKLRHSALSGTGSIAIDPTSVAIRVDVVNRPSNQPVNPGTPNYFFDLGFVTPFAVGTPLRGQRLLYDRQIYQYPTYTDAIGYTLPQGVVIDLVELDVA